MEAINHAGACVGILAKDGVVLAAEKKIHSKVCAVRFLGTPLFPFALNSGLPRTMRAVI